MGGKVTPGPWRWWTSCSWRRLSSVATGKEGDVACPYVSKTDGHPDLNISEADMQFIECAVNACFKVSPNNPQAVAEAIPEIVNMLARFVSATERWNAEVEKTIGRQDETGIPFGPARYLLSRLSLKEHNHP